MGVKVKGVFLLESWTLSSICRATVRIKLLINSPSVAPIIRTQLVARVPEIQSRYLLKTKVKYFMDTAVVYSIIHLIRNLKHLWFITKPNVSIPFPSVPHNSSKISLLIRSAPTKHRRQMKALTSIWWSLGLASLARLKLGWIRICRFVSRKLLFKISSVMRYFHASKGVVAFLAWLITPG